MRIPEYLCYYIIYVYPENIFPIFTGCKDNAFASHCKDLCRSDADVLENTNIRGFRYIIFISLS